MKIATLIKPLIFAAIAFFAAITIMYITSTIPLKKEIAKKEQQINQLNATIVELAKIERYKIENNFEKMKPKDGQIILSIDNQLTPMKPDTLQGKKKSFFNRLKFW